LLEINLKIRSGLGGQQGDQIERILGSNILKNYRSIPHIWRYFIPRLSLCIHKCEQKWCWATFWAIYIYTNSSGHPVCESEPWVLYSNLRLYVESKEVDFVVLETSTQEKLLKKNFQKCQPDPSPQNSGPTIMLCSSQKKTGSTLKGIVRLL
jgi:hypothetical protein